MSRILLADDDRDLQQLLQMGLEENGFSVDVAGDGAEARAFIADNEYDVIVLDWMMPGETGVELCQWCRSTARMAPILLLSSRVRVNDRVLGLDSGADDYLTKPFSFRELVIRLKALSRRSGRRPSRKIIVGPLSVDPDCHTVMLDGTELHLTGKEFSLLEFLVKHPSETVSPETLICRLWSSASRMSQNNVRVYVKRLREKFAAAGRPDLLVNVYGVGYRLQF